MNLQTFIGIVGEAQALTWVGKALHHLGPSERLAENESIHIPMALHGDGERFSFNLDIKLPDDLAFVEAAEAKYKLQMTYKKRESKPFVDSSQFAPEMINKWKRELELAFERERPSFFNRILNINPKETK